MKPIKHDPLPLPLPINSPNGGKKRPNLIIFMPDQLRFDSLGCTSSLLNNNNNPESTTSKQKILTPNIDAFASRGTLFTNCFVQASVCSQSRCSMFTGTYPHVQGHRSLNNLIKPWEPNLFRSLKESGYHVACLSPRGDTFAPQVTELSVTEYGFLETPEVMPGFAKKEDSSSESADKSKMMMTPEEEAREKEKKNSIWSRLFYRGLRSEPNQAMDYDDAVVRSALAWLDCPPTDKPWVLFMPLLFPHCPFQVEEPWFSMYEREGIEMPIGLEGKGGHEPRYMSHIRKRYGTGRATKEIWQEVKATYYGMISRLDDQFGRVVGKVEEKGLWDDTVTFFFTDHGEYLGDHGLIEKWPSGLSEVLVREPLIVAGGGLPSSSSGGGGGGEDDEEEKGKGEGRGRGKGRVAGDMAEMVDLVPTIFELCGVGEHFAHNGESLVGVLMGEEDGESEDEKKKRKKKYAFSEGGFLESEEPLIEDSAWPYDLKAGLQHEDPTLVGKAVSVRDEDWTFVWRLYEEGELYDRNKDPHELRNLIREEGMQEKVREMERVVLRWMVETADVMPWMPDDRFPEVKLKSPREQLEARLKAAREARDLSGV